MQTRVGSGICVFDVQIKNGGGGTITLDSDTSVNVWLEGFFPDMPNWIARLGSE